MSFIQNIFTSRDNNISGNVYVGQLERIWWNPDTNAFYYSDGNTPGGILITGGTSGNGVPGGTINQVQINNGSGGFSGSTNLSFDGVILNVVGDATIDGNVSANYFLGDGSQLTGIDKITSPDTVWELSITNAGVVNFPGGATFTTPGIFQAAVNQPLSVNNYSNTNSVQVQNTNGVNIYAGNVGDTQRVWNFGPDGNLTLPGNSEVSINYANGASILSGLYGNSDVAAYLPTNTSNIGAGNISATGNVTGNYFFGNGSQLTGMYGNANVAAYLPTYTGNITGGNASLTGNVTAAYVIASGGNTVINAGVSTTGNVTGNYIIGNGSQLTGMYGNANVAAYLPTYTGNIAGGNITITGDYYFGNNVALTSILANVDLGNLYIIDQTIYGENTDGNITISPNGTGYVAVPKLALPVGSLVEETIPIIPIIADVTLNAILEYSTSNVGLVPPAYGITIGIPAPWSVLQLTANPSPVLQINDVLSGAGVPIPSAATFIGSGANANVVITNKTFDGLPGPLPGPGTVLAVTREVTLASLEMLTNANTNIALSPGPGGNIIIEGSILPYIDNLYSLGSPEKRFERAYFGPGTIYILDDTLGIDLTLAASAGNLVVGGGSGLTVGKFNLFGNTLTLNSPTEDFFIGNVGSTGNLTVTRRFNVENATGEWKLFDINQATGATTLISNVVSDSTKAAFEVIGSRTRDIRSPDNFGVLLHTSGTSEYPSRIYNDSYGNGTSKYSAYIGRHARGNAIAPTQTLDGDIISRIGANPADSSNTFAPISTTRIDFVNTEDQTPTARGGRIEFWATPVGSNVIAQVASINGTDLVFKPSANRGITFADNTRQTTAYIAANNVTNLTAGSGITLSGTTGNVTIGSTAVLGIIGTPNQINVANVGNVLTLSLPQNFGTNANVTLNELTVTTLNVLGNISNIVPNVIDSTILYLGNAATAAANIDGGGIILGNASQPWYRSILYDLASDTWVVNGGNAGLTTNDIIANTASFANSVHVGDAYNDFDFPDAILQADTSVDSYAQVVLKNHYQGANASSDFVAVSNNGTDGTFYIDLGINSNVYANPDYAVTSANDGYLYVNGGDLVIGTQSIGNVINFFTDGTDNIANIRATISSSGLSVVGNVTGGNIISIALVQGATVSASGSVVGNIVSAAGNVVGGNIITTGQVTATGNITGSNINTAGRVVATGNIVTSGNLVTSNTVINGFGVSTTGNVTGNYFVGNGSLLTGLNAFRTVAANGTNLISSSVAGTLTLTPGNNIVITGNATTITATLAVSDAPTFTGNVTGGNINTAGRITATGNIVTSGNLVTSNTVINGFGVSTTGNVTGNYFVGNGSQLTGMYGDANVAAYLPTYTGNIAGGNISATSNIAGGNVSVTGNIAGNYFFGNGSQQVLNT